jgi:CheY-like chemotaxis protein
MPEAAPPRRVLVVDPLAGTRAIVIAMLEEAGHEALPVADWGSAEDLLLREEIDAVVMALADEDFDGLDAARRLRARLPPESDLPLVGTTSGLRRGEEDDALGAGFDVLVVRPFEAGDLAGALAEATRARTPPPRLDAARRAALRAVMGPAALAAADEAAMAVPARLLAPLLADGGTAPDYQEAGTAVAAAMAAAGAVAAATAARRLAESPTEGRRLLYPLVSAVVAARFALRTDRMTAAREDPIWGASDISPGETP